MRLLSHFVGGAFIVCLGTLMWACGAAVVPPQVLPPQPASVPPVTSVPPENVAPDCALIAEQGAPIATVGLSERVDPANAPHPSNDSERLLFRQLYETLVRPGLAASWRLDGNGRTWIVTLRDNARFSDGAPLTAADVMSSWTTDGIGGGLRSQPNRYVQSIELADDRTLAITLRSEMANEPLVLANANLAIAKRTADSPWPLGTRAVRIAPGRATPDSGGRSVITLTGAPQASTFDTGGDAWFIRFLVAPNRDGRDFLDEGADLLLTRNPATIGYAAALPQFSSVPLAWQRTHVFISRRLGRSSPPPPVEVRQTLARDAVRGEARGADGPFWWQGLVNCEVPRARSQDPGAAPTGRIVYDTNDEASRDLAERLVGIARASSGPAVANLDSIVPRSLSQTFQRAIGMTGTALSLALTRGDDAGYVVAFESRALDPCQDVRALVDRIQWLDPETIVPLVDTRLLAIARRGRSGVTTEWDGGLIIR
jgi:hypothetical protein